MRIVGIGGGPAGPLSRLGFSPPQPRLRPGLAEVSRRQPETRLAGIPVIMYSRIMTKRSVGFAATVSLPALLLTGCFNSEILPKTPYYGVSQIGKRYTPEELHETREVEEPYEVYQDDEVDEVDDWVK